jgi:hypothetical protein
VFQNRVLRRFGSKRDEVIGGWRKLHNKEFRNLHSSPRIITINKSRRMRWIGHVTPIGEKRNAYCDFGEKSRRKEASKKTYT